MIDKSAFGDWDFRIEGIKISDIKNIQNVTVIPIPIFEKNIDVVFESGFEINDVLVKFYRGVNKNRVLLQFNDNEFEALIGFQENGALNFKVDYKNSKIINSVTKQLQFYTAMDLFTSGIAFNVYSEGSLVFTSLEKSENGILDGLKGLYDYNLFYYDYFKKLKEIEQLLKIKFSNIDINEVTDENDSDLEKILAKFKKIPVEQVFKGISFKVPLTPNNLEVFENSVDEKVVPIQLKGHMSNVTIHNQEFVLGNYEIQIVEPVILNLHNILQGSNEKMRIESSKQKAIVVFKE